MAFGGFCVVEFSPVVLRSGPRFHWQVSFFLFEGFPYRVPGVQRGNAVKE